MRNYVSCCATLSDAAKICPRLHNPVRYCTNMSDTVQICPMLHKYVRCCTDLLMLQYFIRCCTNMPYAAHLYHMLYKSIRCCPTLSCGAQLLNSICWMTLSELRNSLLLHQSVSYWTTQSDAAQLCQMLYKYFFCCTTLFGAVQIYQMLHNFVRYCTTLSDIAQPCQILHYKLMLPNSVRYWTYPSDTEKLCSMLYNFTRQLYQILNDFFWFFTTLSNAAELFSDSAWLRQYIKKCVMWVEFLCLHIVHNHCIFLGT